MRTKRQNNQLELAFVKDRRGEAPRCLGEGTEVRVAQAGTEGPAAGLGPTMEEVVEPGNLKKALGRVRRNKGAPGVDGMRVGGTGRPSKGTLVGGKGPSARWQLQTAGGEAR